jgi:hypothetical protein
VDRRNDESESNDFAGAGGCNDRELWLLQNVPKLAQPRIALRDENSGPSSDGIAGRIGNPDGATAVYAAANGRTDAAGGDAPG